MPEILGMVSGKGENMRKTKPTEHEIASVSKFDKHLFFPERIGIGLPWLSHHKILDDLGKSRFTFEPCRTVTGLQPSRMVNSLPFRSSNLWAQKLTTAQEVIRKDPWRTRNERDLEHSAILGHLLL